MIPAWEVGQNPILVRERREKWSNNKLGCAASVLALRWEDWSIKCLGCAVSALAPRWGRGQFSILSLLVECLVEGGLKHPNHKVVRTLRGSGSPGTSKSSYLSLRPHSGECWSSSGIKSLLISPSADRASLPRLRVIQID